MDNIADLVFDEIEKHLATLKDQGRFEYTIKSREIKGDTLYLTYDLILPTISWVPITFNIAPDINMGIKEDIDLLVKALSAGGYTAAPAVSMSVPAEAGGWDKGPVTKELGPEEKTPSIHVPSAPNKEWSSTITHSYGELPPEPKKILCAVCGYIGMKDFRIKSGDVCGYCVGLVIDI